MFSRCAYRLTEDNGSSKGKGNSLFDNGRGTRQVPRHCVHDDDQHTDLALIYCFVCTEVHAVICGIPGEEWSKPFSGPCPLALVTR